MAASRRVRVRIEGRVQGVFFRLHAREAAATEGLRGWVRNRDDGSVEAVAEGPSEAVDRFLRWCRRGSPAARVDRVAETDEIADDTLVGFVVRT